MNKAYLQETPSTWNNGQAPLPRFYQFLVLWQDSFWDASCDKIPLFSSKIA